MMTTADLRNRNLKTGIGYEKKDVDIFLEEIIASYEELYRSNVELTDRVTSLNEGLQHYKTIEASLQKTLILAERTAEETVNEAKEKAKQIEEEAKGNTGKIAQEAKKELDAIVAKTSELVNNYNELKAKIKADLSRQMMELDNSQISFDSTKYTIADSFSATATMESSTSVQPEVKAEPVISTPVQPQVKVEPTPTPVQPQVKVEPTPVSVQPEEKVEATNIPPQPAAAKFLRPEPEKTQPEPSVEPVIKEEKTGTFNLNLGANSSANTTANADTQPEKENKLGLNLNSSSLNEDNNYDDPDEDSYDFEVEDSSFRSKRNANGQMLIGNDDEESGFEFLSEL